MKKSPILITYSSSIWQLEKYKYILIAILILSTISCSVSDKKEDENLALEQKTYHMLARTSSTMSIQFQIREDEAQKLLPKTVSVKSNSEGLVNGGIEVYKTKQVYGVPTYSIAFATLEINKIKSNEDVSGNWAIWGVMNNDASLQNFKDIYHLPYIIEKNISFEQDEDEYNVIIGDIAKRGLRLRLKINSDKPFAGEGLANMYSQNKNEQILKTAIPWLAEGHEANIISFEIWDGGDETLQIIKRAKPIFGAVSSNTFSYTTPEYP